LEGHEWLSSLQLILKISIHVLGGGTPPFDKVKTQIVKNIHIFIINVKDYTDCFNVNKMCVTSLNVDIFENYIFKKKKPRLCC
jgi:hypothetical protein